MIAEVSRTPPSYDNFSAAGCVCVPCAKFSGRISFKSNFLGTLGRGGPNQIGQVSRKIPLLSDFWRKILSWLTFGVAKLEKLVFVSRNALKVPRSDKDPNGWAISASCASSFPKSVNFAFWCLFGVWCRVCLGLGALVDLTYVFMSKGTHAHLCSGRGRGKAVGGWLCGGCLGGKERKEVRRRILAVFWVSGRFGY